MSKPTLDYSWARPEPQAIVDAGYQGVFRYLSHDPGKTIEKAEADSLRAVGLDLGFVWESYATRALAGRSAGKQDAEDAVAQLKALGAPDNVAIYGAVDFDINDAQKPAAGDYLKGMADVVGLDRVATYGGYWWVKYAKENGLATKFWQTLAWSGGQVHPATHIYQNGRTAFNAGADIDDVLIDDYGQWKAGTAPQPVPQPTPQPQPSPISGEITYVVKPGEILSIIAPRYGLSYQQLADYNHIADPNKIYAGEVLKIPTGGGSTPAPAPIPNGIVYTVKWGDTLGAIGRLFNVDYHLIAQVNNIPNPDKISVGQVLRIPGGGAPTPAPGIIYYTVQPGDILSRIASKYGTSYQHLAQINNIPDPDKIYAGQVIKIF